MNHFFEYSKILKKGSILNKTHKKSTKNITIKLAIKKQTGKSSTNSLSPSRLGHLTVAN
jgi:hypothetical protein